MLKQHKNAFFDAIQDSGLDPALFSASETEVSFSPSTPFSMIVRKIRYLFREESPRGPVFDIKIDNSPMKFSVMQGGSFGHAYCRFTLFLLNFPVVGWGSQKPVKDILVTFKGWLENHAKKYIQEIQLPDYWSQMEMFKSFVADAEPNEGNREEFTEEEREVVRQSVQRFRGLLEEHFDPTPEQKEFINERLDYLTKAVDRLNKFDWRGLAFSTLVSISVNLTVDTERGKILFHLFKEAFKATVKLLQ